MSVNIDLKELQAKFILGKRYYTRKVMVYHISYDHKKVGDIPKDIVDELPLTKFKNYFQKIVVQYI